MIYYASSESRDRMAKSNVPGNSIKIVNWPQCRGHTTTSTQQPRCGFFKTCKMKSLSQLQSTSTSKPQLWFHYILGLGYEMRRDTPDPHKFRYNFNLRTIPDYGNRGLEFIWKCPCVIIWCPGCESVTIEFVLKPVINGEKQSSPRAELSGPVNIFSTAVRQSLIGMSLEGNI